MHLKSFFDKFRKIEHAFLNLYNVDDIYSNSKIYEILIANRFGDSLIPGHSGSRDAKDADGNELEYKHFKETSSNHTWTFNDFSDTTIAKLHDTPWVYFVYIDDKNYAFPGNISWYFKVSGHDMAEFLTNAVLKIKNKRKMINISVKNLESMGYSKINLPNFDISDGKYGDLLLQIVDNVTALERLTETHGLLTSNKLWELLIASELHHKINSEQGGRDGAHDASDDEGHLFEYKVSKTYSWNFQDISENVLKKYLLDYKIILAVVDKTSLTVKEIFSADPSKVVTLLMAKLQSKIENFSSKGKSLRRLQVSLSKGDLKKIDAKKIV